MDYARCPKCGDKGQAGEHIGTLLVSATIKAYSKGPFIDIARIVKCVKCGYIHKIYLLDGPPVIDEDGVETNIRQPGEAQKNGITKAMIVNALSQMNVDTFAMDELKSGVVRGGRKRNIDYDPNKYIEQKEVEQGEIF